MSAKNCYRFLQFCAWACSVILLAGVFWAWYTSEIYDKNEDSDDMDCSDLDFGKVNDNVNLFGMITLIIGLVYAAIIALMLAHSVCYKWCCNGEPHRCCECLCGMLGWVAMILTMLFSAGAMYVLYNSWNIYDTCDGDSDILYNYTTAVWIMIGGSVGSCVFSVLALCAGCCAHNE